MLPQIKKNLLVFFKDSKINLISFIVLPMVLAFIYGNMQKDMFDGKEHSIKTMEVNFIYDKETLEGKILTQVLNEDSIKKLIEVNDEAKDFEVTISNNFENVEIKAKSEGDAQTVVLQNFMKAFIDNINQYKAVGNIITTSGVDPSQADIIQGKIMTTINELNSKGSIKETLIEGYRTVGASEYYTISIFTFTTILLILSLAKNFYKDKKEEILKRTFAAPCEKKKYYLGYILSNTAIIALVITVYVLVNRILKIAFLENMVGIFLIIICISFLAANVSGILVAFFKEEKTASLFMNILLFIPIISGGVFFPIDYIEVNWLKYISILSPNYLMLTSFKEFAITGSLNNIGIELISMIVLSIFLLVIGYNKVNYKWEV